MTPKYKVAFLPAKRCSHLSYSLAKVRELVKRLNLKGDGNLYYPVEAVSGKAVKLWKTEAR